MKFNSHAELSAWALEARDLWLFLDYDGTLSDFAPTPDEIVPDADVVRLLDRLRRKPDRRVTILSGRRLAHIRQLLPLDGIMLAGTYGIELQKETGEVLARAEYDRIRPTLERIKPHWADLIWRRSGFYLEDKGWSLALHGRFADDKEAGQVFALALETAAAKMPAGQLRILGGHKFLEVAPHAASKKETVTYLLSQYPAPERRLLYIGDDDKDEEAFPVIHAHRGAVVKVMQASQASQPTSADFFFRSPAETLHWLATLV